MISTLLPYLVAQIPRLFGLDTGGHLCIAIAAFISVGGLAAYCTYQVVDGHNSWFICNWFRRRHLFQVLSLYCIWQCLSNVWPMGFCRHFLCGCDFTRILLKQLRVTFDFGLLQLMAPWYQEKRIYWAQRKYRRTHAIQRVCHMSNEKKWGSLLNGDGRPNCDVLLR